MARSAFGREKKRILSAKIKSTIPAGEEIDEDLENIENDFDDSSNWYRLENSGINNIRGLFLRSMSMVYFVAFLSLYFQIEGLFGSNGITPIKAELKLNTRDPESCFKDKLSLLCYIPNFLGIDTQHSAEILALIGIILSAFGSLCVHCCVAPTFALLWILYFSIYQVGGVFLWFQWDILLLESGLLAILVSPWLPTKGQLESKPRDYMTIWMVKWLLFRLMFSSGIVKLSSGCPKWWGLTALDYHFESQCLPTPLSYFAHHLQPWILKLMVVGTYYIEIVVPFGFFAPLSFVRKFSFYLQVIFQLSIILTGNYNFFNLLTLVLCISLLEYDYFNKQKAQVRFTFGRFCNLFISWFLIGMTFYYTWINFGIKVNPDFTISSKIMFKKVDYDWFIGIAVPYSMALGCLTLFSVIARSMTMAMLDVKTCWGKLTSLTSTLFYGAVCVGIFSISLVPLSALHKETSLGLWKPIKFWHNELNKFHLVSSYGLFRRMTGTEGGRPELILEYSDDVNGPWKEFHFMHKPGNLSAMPTIALPHQPRLDWQLWFASLSTYHDNPWLVSLVYRILQGNEEVKKLMDMDKMPSKPPKYIKGSLFHYTYTEQDKADWWKRKRQNDYLPIFSKEHPPLVEYVKKMGYLDDDYPSKVNENLTAILDKIRITITNAAQPEMVIWASLLSILIIIFTSKLF